MTMLDPAEVQRRLEYRPPTDATRPAYELSRALVRLLFETWNRALPAGRELALALTALEEAHTWANAAVARNAGETWQLEPVDVSELVDDVLERLEGPLHLRTSSSNPGPRLEGLETGEIDPDEPESDGIEPDPAPARARDAVTLAELEGPLHRRAGGRL